MRKKKVAKNNRKAQAAEKGLRQVKNNKEKHSRVQVNFQRKNPASGKGGAGQLQESTSGHSGECHTQGGQIKCLPNVCKPGLQRGSAEQTWFACCQDRGTHSGRRHTVFPGQQPCRTSWSPALIVWSHTFFAGFSTTAYILV